VAGTDPARDRTAVVADHRRGGYRLTPPAAGTTSEHRDPNGMLDTATRDRARRRFSRASALGAGLGAVVFVWMLTRGTFDLFQWQRIGDFYDFQAHSILGGHLSVNGLRLGVEAFTVDGSAYIYQGPLPAILRLPFVALAGSSLDGRLTQSSMLVAFLVAIVFACRLHWKARGVLRDDVPVGRVEAFLVALFTFALAGGSVLVYEASRAWVYHEALLWGCAFALASLDFMISYIVRPTRLALSLSVAFAACGLLTRASVGVGPVVGLGLLALGMLVVRIRDRWPHHFDVLRHLRWLAPGHDGERTPRTSSVWLLGAAAVAPLVAYAVVNFAKFGTLFSVPFYSQQFSQIDAGRQAFLAENGGSLFGLKFVPTTVLQYLRPDSLRFTSTFPFVDFASFPGPIIGDFRFDLFDRSSSLPTALPFFFVLAVAGLWVLFRPSSWSAGSRLGPLRVPTFAAAAGAFTILPFGFIANRYLSDFLPLLVLGAAIGLQALVRREAATPRARWVVPAIVGLVAAVIFMTWVNLGLALRYQRQWSYNLDPDVVAGFAGFQQDVAGALGSDGLSVERGSELPNGIGRPGRLFVVGDCDGLYISDGMELNGVKTTPWNAVERTAAAGHFRLHAAFPSLPVGTRVPLFTTGTAEKPNILFAEYAPDDEILFEYDAADPAFRGRYVPFPVEPDRPYTIDIAADSHTGSLTVMLDDVGVLDTLYAYRGDDFLIGRNPHVPTVERRFPGPLERVPTRAPLCNELLRG
jgi:hypothetical protein